MGVRGSVMGGDNERVGKEEQGKITWKKRNKIKMERKDQKKAQKEKA